MSILKVKDKDGVFVNIPSIIGPKGDAGAPGPQGPQGPKGDSHMTYNAGDGQIKYDGNSCKVASAVNADKWGNRMVWVGAEGSRPGSGYIQFCY